MAATLVGARAVALGDAIPGEEGERTVLHANAALGDGERIAILMHHERCYWLALALAAALGMQARAAVSVALAGWFHDVGELFGPVAPHPAHAATTHGRGDPRHTRVAHDLLYFAAELPADARCTFSEVALHHHERFDGHGYPHGLVGAEIPLSARLIAVVDAYDASLIECLLRSRLPRTAARQRLVSEAGGALDPTLVAHFIALLRMSAPARLRMATELHEAPASQIPWRAAGALLARLAADRKAQPRAA